MRLRKVPRSNTLVSLFIDCGPCWVIAGILMLSAMSYAQSQPQAASSQTTPPSAPSQASQVQTPPATQPKPAKVWTNDETDALHNNHGVSVVGNSLSAKKAKANVKTRPPEKDPAWYRSQLIPLQADSDKLVQQIAKLQAFLNGESVGEAPTMHRHLAPSPADQLKQMEAKRQADIAKIDDLLDLARRNGIEPGALR